MAPRAENRAAMVARFRKLADQARGPGMSIGVRGTEFAAVVSLLDELQARADVCEASLAVAPKKGAKAKDDPRLVAALEVIGEADVVLSGEPSRWGQSLLAALSERCADDGRDMPAEWRAVIGEAVSVGA